MGLGLSTGYGTTEEYIIDKDTGVVLNPDLLDYKLVTILDMPKVDDLQTSFVEYPAAWGAYGSKGFSETGGTTGAPAIANAVYNAIGVRIRGEKVTPAAILEALAKQKQV
jgi:xanthine dehydrogenase molybdenum-binding subunit